MKDIKRKNLPSYMTDINKIVLADIMFTGDCDSKTRQNERLVKIGRGALSQPIVTGFKVPKGFFDKTIENVSKKLQELDMHAFAKEVGGNTLEDIKSWLRYNLEGTKYLNYFRTFTYGECHVTPSTLNILRTVLRNDNYDANFISNIDKLYTYYRLQEIYNDAQYMQRTTRGNIVKPKISLIHGNQITWGNVKGFTQDGFAYYATQDPTMDYYALSPYLFKEQMLLAVLATFLRTEERNRSDVLLKRTFRGKTYKRLGGDNRQIMENAITYSRQMTHGYLFKDLTREQENDLVQDILSVMPRTCDGEGKEDFVSVVLETSKLRDLSNGVSSAIGTVYSTVYAIYSEAIMGLWVKELMNSITWAKQNVANLNCDVVYANAKTAIIGIDKNVKPSQVLGNNANYIIKLNDVSFDTLISNRIADAYVK